MRLYDFRCQACNHVFEDLVESADDPATCPACASPGATRQLSAFAIGRSDGASAQAERSSAPVGGCFGGGCGGGMCGV